MSEALTIGLARERGERERRVALTPRAVAGLVENGVRVLVERGAGEGAHFPDAQYAEAAAQMAASVYGKADLIVGVGKPDIDALTANDAVASMLQPLVDHASVRALAASGATSFSLDTIPRIARAQSMDVLSSMASLAGYKAAVLAASALGKFFPMMIAASGTTPPAKGLVLGAGVAGLQAIATARRFGAVMTGYDIRPAAREQVESLGANFLAAELREEAEDAGGYAREQTEDERREGVDLVRGAVRDMDFVIATAAAPGRPAPRIIDADMVSEMSPGAVIIDVAAETGGNCELTRPGETVVEHGVTIIGPLNLPSSMPTHASMMYSRNMLNFINHMVRDGEIVIDRADEITKGCLITRGGEIVHDGARAAMGEDAP